MTLQEFYLDLHIHIGRDSKGRAVKVTGAPSLRLENIAQECLERKGIEIIGVVDSASPLVLEDYRSLLAKGFIREMAEGGMRYRDRITILLGAEVETREPGGGLAHWLIYFPSLADMELLSKRIAQYCRNPDLSTPPVNLSSRELVAMATDLGGLVMVAHAFTPHKSVYGSCTHSLRELLGIGLFSRLAAVELGLSSDSALADRLEELNSVPFITNSDAHSLGKIGREYNTVLLANPTYAEVKLALKGQEGRCITGNWGLHPCLGKYHRTRCLECGFIASDPSPVKTCIHCGSTKTVYGVLDRLTEIADFPVPRHPHFRPPYNYQVPLQFLPGVGPRTLQRLLERFGTEMEVIHRAPWEELRQVIGSKGADLILQARRGELAMETGGGGSYGRILAEKPH